MMLRIRTNVNEVKNCNIELQSVIQGFCKTRPGFASLLTEGPVFFHLIATRRLLLKPGRENSELRFLYPM